MEFLDGEGAASTHSQGPLLHHFCSSNFRAEEDYLAKCWKECLENGVILPINVVRVDDGSGQMKVVRLLPEDTTTNKSTQLDDDQEQPQPSCNLTEKMLLDTEIVGFHVHPHDNSDLPSSELDDSEASNEPNNPSTLNSAVTITESINAKGFAAMPTAGKYIQTMNILVIVLCIHAFINYFDLYLFFASPNTAYI